MLVRHSTIRAPIKLRRRGVAWGVFGHPTTSSLFYYWIPYQKRNGGRYVRSGTECLFIDPEVEHSVVEAKYLRVVFKRHNRIRNEKGDVNHPPILHPVTSPRGRWAVRNFYSGRVPSAVGVGSPLSIQLLGYAA
jgi:hypothetical protein